MCALQCSQYVCCSAVSMCAAVQSMCVALFVCVAVLRSQIRVLQCGSARVFCGRTHECGSAVKMCAAVQSIFVLHRLCVLQYCAVKYVRCSVGLLASCVGGRTSVAVQSKSVLQCCQCVGCIVVQSNPGAAVRVCSRPCGEFSALHRDTRIKIKSREYRTSLR